MLTGPISLTLGMISPRRTAGWQARALHSCEIITICRLLSKPLRLLGTYKGTLRSWKNSNSLLSVTRANWSRNRGALQIKNASRNNKVRRPPLKISTRSGNLGPSRWTRKGNSSSARLREYRNRSRSPPVNRRAGPITLIHLKLRWEHWQTPHRTTVASKSQRADLTQEWQSRKKKTRYTAVWQRERRNWWRRESTSRKSTRFGWAKLLVGIWTSSWMGSRSACLTMGRRSPRAISKKKLRPSEFYSRRRGSSSTA